MQRTNVDIGVWLSLSLVLAAGCDESATEPRGDAPVELAALAEPSVEDRPWVRWWWPGGDVEPERLRAELDLIAAAGFGGVEVQAFDAALDASLSEDVRARIADVRSERFGDAVAGVIEHAGRLGLRVDLTFGSGWPAGGSHVGPDDASTTLMWWEQTVTGPVELDVGPTPMPSVFFTVAQIAEATFGERLGRFLPELAQPVAAYAARVTDGRRDPSPLALDDTIDLLSESVVDLTDRWNDGRLTWSVPTGRWQVVAVFAGPAGDYITLTAEPGDPFAVDHLDARAVRATADSWFADGEAWGDAWRGVFNDSLEFKVDRLFTDDLLEEFEARRGYALDWGLLAVLTQSADSFLLDAGRVRAEPEFRLSDGDERIRWDYRQTVSELFVERFVGELATWAEERGRLVRSQSYGIDVDVIAALGAAHIPEAETLYAGGSRLFLKMASSAAHLHGRERASSEAFSFILRDHMTTPLKVRAVADLQLVSGIDELVYHGFPYAAAGEYGLPGWTPFSSPFGGVSTFGSTFGERWEYAWALPALNRYVARSQSLMREGAPGADLLILYPFFGFPTSLPLSEDHVEPLLGGYLPGLESDSREVPFGEIAALLGPPVEDPRVTWLVALGAVLDVLEGCGWTWEWVNPERLGAAEVSDDGELTIGGARYGGLLVADTPEVTVDTARAIEAIASAGARVVLAGSVPERSPSYAERFASASVRGAISSALEGPRVSRIGALEGLAGALSGEPRRASTECGGRQRIAWRLGTEGPRVALIANLHREPSSQDWAIEECDDAVLYDAWSHSQRPWDGTVELSPYSSAFVVCGASVDAVPVVRPRVSGALVEPGPWRLSVESAVEPDEVVEREGEVLGDWRGDPELVALSGEAVYRAGFEVDDVGDAELVVGEVYGAARVAINGEVAGELLVPPWRLPIGEHLRSGANELEIRLTPPLRNELIARGEAGDPHYAHFVGKTGTEVASGLLGPVEVHLRRPNP